MKVIKKYSAIIALIVLAVYDAIVLILRDSEKYNKMFWLGFAFVQVAFVLYIVAKLVFKNKEEERGVKPLDLTLFFLIVLMLLMSFIAYCLPEKHGALIGMLVGYITLLGIAAILVVFGFVNKAVVKSVSEDKPLVFDENDVKGLVQKAYDAVKDEAVKNQIAKILERLENKEVDTNTPAGKKVAEYVQFMYKNAIRNELSNISYNIKKVNEALNELM